MRVFTVKWWFKLLRRLTDGYLLMAKVHVSGPPVSKNKIMNCSKRYGLYTLHTHTIPTHKFFDYLKQDLSSEAPEAFLITAAFLSKLCYVQVKNKLC